MLLELTTAAVSAFAWTVLYKLTMAIFSTRSGSSVLIEAAYARSPDDRLPLLLRDHIHRAEWSCRLVAVFHAVLVISLCGFAQLIQGPYFFDETTLFNGWYSADENTRVQQLAVFICYGYFLFDLIWSLYHGTEDPVMLLHHCASLLGMIICGHTNRYGSEITVTIFIAEISNPLLQARWFLRSEGYSDTIFASVLDICFVLTFTAARLGLGTLMMLRYLPAQGVDNLGRTGAFIIYIIGWLFWVQIAAFAARKIRKSLKRRAERTAERLGSKEE